MLLQRTTAVVEVMNLHLYMLRIAKRHKFLLHRIPRETITYAKDSYDEHYIEKNARHIFDI